MTEDLFSNQAWKAVLNAIPQGIVAVDRDGNIAYLNPYAEMALGLRNEAALGQHFRDVFCPSLPLHRCGVNHALAACKPLRQHRFEMERPDAQPHSLRADFTPILDGTGAALGAIITVEQNGTSRLLVEQLQNAQHTHEAIVGSIADGLFTVDREWRITSFNRAAERSTGWREGEVLGKLCSQVLQSDRCRDGCPLARTLEQREDLFDYETNICDRDGHSKRVMVNTAVLFNREGAPIGGVVSFRDTSLLEKWQEQMQLSSQFHGIVGKHKRMLEIYELISEVADSDSTVLIMGESGTGKEMFANALVQLSHRSGKPFIKVNCSVFPETLLESELFGHVKGAFTDARQDRIGRFELANGGNILLDEIGEISAAAQVKLLRVLEEKEFERVGSSETIKVDVRVIAATNLNLPQRVEEKRFREDLYYRLNVIPIMLPPLRERGSDVPLLMDHFMAKYRLLTGKSITRVSDRAMDLFMSYEYPGNVRELENAVEHAFARTTGNLISEEKLPLALRQNGNGRFTETPLPEDDSERRRILQALERSKWNRSSAAKVLGMSRTTLWRRMQELGILESEA